jgi:osmotically-inducible protein OsmY
VTEVNETNHDLDTTDTPDSYVVEHATTALACDPRVGALDIQITVEHGRVTAHGAVETEARRAAIESVLTELLPDHQINVAVTVSQTPTDEPTVEELP